MTKEQRLIEQIAMNVLKKADKEKELLRLANLRAIEQERNARMMGADWLERVVEFVQAHEN